MSVETLNFRVRSSSSDEVYEITATFVPRLKITCTCMGGVSGQACKHRTALLLEDTSSLIEVDPVAVKALAEAAKASPLGEAMSQMAGLEREADALKRKMSAQKKVIARIMNGASEKQAEYAGRF